jgi:hypothetical protein
MSLSSLILSLAAVMLGLALQLNDGLYSAAAAALVGASLLACAVGALARVSGWGSMQVKGARIGLTLLVAALMGVMLLKTAGASAQTVPPVDQTAFRLGVIVAMFAVVCIGLGSPRLALAGFIVLLVAHAAVGVWKIRAAPEPIIDVWVFQTESPRKLAEGINPYSIDFPNIYGPDTYVYGPGIVQDGRLRFGYPYPPLVLLLTAPAQLLLGDFRYAQLAAMLLAAMLIVRIRPDAIGMLAAALLLFTPRSFYVLESGWTEPLSVTLLAATVAAARSQPTLAAMLFGLLIASKQYLPAAIALSPLLPDRLRGYQARELAKLLAIALVVAVAVTAPLAVWDIGAFVHSTLTLQFHQPYRPDALSLLAWWGSDRPGWVGPSWVCFLALGVSIGLSLWRARSFAAAFALAFFAFFALNKQAFANYYYLVIGALCCAVACENFTSASRRADN